MKLLYLFLLFTISSCDMSWTEIEEVCGMSGSDRIIGGTTASLGAYPWIAHLGFMRKENGESTLSYECGASLIHPKFVVSAAHCINGLKKGESIATVKLGEHNLNTAIDCEGKNCADEPQIIYPLRIIMPVEYNDEKMKHDIALIELKEPAKITRFVSPVCLPTGDLISKTLLNQLVEVAGWGYYDIDDPKSSPILQVVRLPVVHIDKCRDIKQLKQYEFSKGQICVGGVEGKGSNNKATYLKLTRS